MNILYLCDEYPPGPHGGIGTYVRVMARKMAALGNRVVVAGFYGGGYGTEDKFEDEGVHVYRFRRGLASDEFINPQTFMAKAQNKIFKITGVFQRDIERSLEKYHLFLEQLIKEYEIDIAEMPDYNDYMRFCNTYVSFPKLSVPVIVKLHGSFTHLGKEMNNEVPAHIVRMEYDILQQATAVVSVSKYAAEKTAERLDYHKEITVLYNGIDTAAAIPAVGKVPNRVVFAGTLVALKGIYQLAKAWNIVARQYPQAELIILGKGPQEKVKALLDKPAAETVKFMGHVPVATLRQYFAGAAIAIFPSYTETFGLAALEAMACKTAVIYTCRASGPEIIDNGIDGILIDPDNVEEMANKLLYLLSHPEICSSLAGSARKKVENKFSLDVAADRHLAFFEKIIAQTR